MRAETRKPRRKAGLGRLAEVGGLQRAQRRAAYRDPLAVSIDHALGGARHRLEIDEDQLVTDQIPIIVHETDLISRMHLELPSLIHVRNSRCAANVAVLYTNKSPKWFPFRISKG